MKKPVLTALLHMVLLHLCLSQALPPLTTLVSPAAIPRGRSAGPAIIPAAAIIRVKNNSSGNLSNLALQWQMQVNGLPGQKGTVFPLLIRPGQSANFRLPAKIPNGPKDEVFLNIRYILKKQDSLHPAGYIIASDQLLLLPAHETDCTVQPKGDLTFTDENGLFTVSSPHCNLQFNKQTGRLLHYMAKGNSLLDEEQGLRPDYWEDQEPKLQLFSTSTATNIAVVSADYSLPGVFCLLHIRYTVNADGEVLVGQTLEVDSTQFTNTNLPADSMYKGPALPRFGMQWTLPAGLDSVAYYGRGGSPTPGSPPEIGIYRQLAPQQASDIRWYKITGKDGHGMQITADSSLLSVSALQPQPQSQPRTLLNIDYPSFHLPFGNYHFFYKVTPL